MLASHVVRDCLYSSTLHELNLTFTSLFKKECVRVRPAFSYALVAAAQCVHKLLPRIFICV